MIPVPQPVQEQLAQLFGSTADSLSPFGGGHEASDGIVYAYPHGDTQRLLKVMAIPVENQRRGVSCMEERLRFMRFLGENGAPIAFPQLSEKENLYETHLSDSHLWVGYSMEIAPGETMDGRAWNEAVFRNWGQTIGMLHRLTRQYPSWETSVDPASGEHFLNWREEWEGFYRSCQDEEVKGKWAEIGEQLEALPITREVFGFIHNDPHLSNLLVDGDQITLLDFDVAKHHWFITDIAIACQSIVFSLSGGMHRPVHDREKVIAFRDCFMEGYEREHHLDSEWLDRLDLFIAYRRILLFTAMYDSIRSMPDFHDPWKQVILSQPDVIGD
jgi:amicoumacin kinase